MDFGLENIPGVKATKQSDTLVRKVTFNIQRFMPGDYQNYSGGEMESIVIRPIREHLERLFGKDLISYHVDDFHDPNGRENGISGHNVGFKYTVYVREKSVKVGTIEEPPKNNIILFNENKLF